MTVALWTSRQRMIFAMVAASLTDAVPSAAETSIHRELKNATFANTATPAGKKEKSMHPLILKATIEAVRKREIEGDCQVTAQPPVNLLECAVFELAAELEKLKACTEFSEPAARNCNEECPGNKTLEGISDPFKHPQGCICEPDTTRCPYDEAEEDRANRQAARELLNCGQYR